ncbi:hypothetical protein G5S35_03990 [Paraburkholderia tropica]|uniref:hypothetical protein n=1 Tax=Paraburkholderia tropica TaxID=92647 RepID=UPI001600A842|nr:hypothetical protein [Paraburkholderia tropica]QNB10816.1 hypothetical protein G5S35_03990 [Paraburkholderia tropica]
MSRSSFAVNLDTTQFEAAVDDHVQRQLPYAASVALNRTGKAVIAVEQATMRNVFDRPTPYTLNALRLKPATKTKLIAEVSYKDESFKGTPATKYLAPQVDGGPRSVKRVEALLRARGLLPADMYTVPGSAAKVDQYGNFSRGQYSQILAQLQASRDSAQNETPTSRRRKRRNPTADVRYFVGRPGGGRLPLGVWARYQFAQGYAVRPILMFVRAPTYSRRFPFYDVADATSAATLPTEMEAALAMALATRR